MDESNKVAPQDAKTDSKTETLDSTLGSQESQIQPENALKAENQEPAKSEVAKAEVAAESAKKVTAEPSAKALEKPAKSTDKTAEKTATRKKLMNNGNELKKALDSWNQLAKEPLPPSPNEQMLNDVKDLLKQLKDKIEEFK